MTADDSRVDPLRLDGVGFLLLLAVLPLVSYGTTQEIELLWMLGLILLAVGTVIPLLTEFGIRRRGNSEETAEAEQEHSADEAEQSDQ